ncbi:hypothetical protein G5V59_04575 [Nocardioides sp. W3-2-3]|uniref:hypothetical protein n=1 Tax=Nocardioides convexus TaxID=2712224 RepID=UPI0024186A75|nr:hypothetical protein [Nocardioides convexus]NGZ99833.1 hypothetical protein [Nocardioides convexus]
MSTAGWRLLLGLALRRDRVLAGVWVALLVLMSVASAAATPSLYADQADRVHAAEALNASPAIVALYGPVLDVTSEGEPGHDQDDGALRRLRRGALHRGRPPPHPGRGGVGPDRVWSEAPRSAGTPHWRPSRSRACSSPSRWGCSWRSATR